MTTSGITKSKSEPLAEYRTALEKAHRIATALEERMITPETVVTAWNDLDQRIRTMEGRKESERYLPKDDVEKRKFVDEVQRKWDGIRVPDWLLNSRVVFKHEPHDGIANYTRASALFNPKEHKQFATAGQVYDAFKRVYHLILDEKMADVAEALVADQSEPRERTFANQAHENVYHTVMGIRRALNGGILCNTTGDYAWMPKEKRSFGSEYNGCIHHVGDLTITFPIRRPTDQILPFLTLSPDMIMRKYMQAAFSTYDEPDHMAEVFALVSGVPADHVLFDPYARREDDQQNQKADPPWAPRVLSLGYHPRDKSLIVTCNTPVECRGAVLGIDLLKRAVDNYHENRRKDCHELTRDTTLII